MIKLIALFALLLIIALISWRVTTDYEKCYSNREHEGYASMGVLWRAYWRDKSY